MRGQIEGAAMLVTSHAMSNALEDATMSDHTSDSPTLQIPTPTGHIAIIDEIDSDLLGFKWHAIESKSTYYIGRSVKHPKATTVSLHVVILERVLKRSLVKGEVCDHWDLNGLNNCRSNLRLATVSQNMHNRGSNSNNTSGYKGVFWNKKAKSWWAQIYCDSKPIYLGSFKSPHKAARAYNEAALKHHGEFARLNVISDEAAE
jgi:hypothetical protein